MIIDDQIAWEKKLEGENLLNLLMDFMVFFDKWIEEHNGCFSDDFEKIVRDFMGKNTGD